MFEHQIMQHTAKTALRWEKLSDAGIGLTIDAALRQIRQCEI